MLYTEGTKTETKKKGRGRPKNTTPSHSCFVRVPGELFAVVENAAKTNKTTLSDVIVTSLKTYFKL